MNSVQAQAHPRAYDLKLRLDASTDKFERREILREYIELLRTDFPTYCALLLKVKPKGGGMLAPFVFNQAQQYVWKVMVRLMQAARPLFLVILKARQEGISTFVCAWNHWHLWRQREVQTMTIAHQMSTAETMIETMRVFHDELPDDLKPALREGNHGASIPRGEIYYADRRSWGLIHVAKNLDPRGQQVTHVHETEYAMYPNPTELNAALLPQLPPYGSKAALSSSVIVESTPKGENEFYWLYKEGKKEGSMWTSIFLPWFIYDEEYSAKAPVGWRMSEEEEQLRKAYSLDRQEYDGKSVSRDQMYWREQMIEGYYNGDLDKFDREYPADDISCFLLESKSIYRPYMRYIQASVHAAEERVEVDWRSAGVNMAGRHAPKCKLVYEHRDNFYQKPGTTQIQIDSHGKWTIWAPPKKGHLYVIGGDVAAGTDEGDYSSMCIIDVSEARQVAELKGRISAERYADEMDAAGRLYNMALLVPEVNGLGYVVLGRLGANLIYPNLFKWPKWDEVQKYSHKRGWETNRRTKLLMISRSMYVLEERLIQIASRELMGEMSVFQQRNEPQELEPSFGAPRGKHDDLVVAFALAVQGIMQTPRLSAAVGGSDFIPNAQELGISAAPMVLAPKVDPAEELQKLTGSYYQDLYPADPLGGVMGL